MERSLGIEETLILGFFPVPRGFSSFVTYSKETVVLLFKGAEEVQNCHRDSTIPRDHDMSVLIVGWKTQASNRKKTATSVT